MDIATIIGLLAGTALILSAILMSSDMQTFINYPSVLIVVGGSITSTLCSFPIKSVFGVAKVFKNCVLTKARDPGVIIAEMVKYAEVARRDGILALDNMTEEISDPFMVSGIQMAVDGTDPELIEAILMSDLDAIEARHSEGKALFETIGRFAPAFGMIGTLIGLVILLKNMEDPSTIGPAMAISLLTTLYGALVANVFALPMADKLARRSREEMLLKMIIVKGVMSIQSGDNPRIVEQKLKTFMPARLRASVEIEAAA